ncbi:MAG: ribosome recycling factor [Salibacteraceae bacterium]
MNEDIQMVLDMVQESMDKSMEHLKVQLSKIRVGRATPGMLETVKVDAYGSLMPINQTANVNTLDARTLTVQAWDKGLLPSIERAIINSNLGLNPQNNGEMIIINVPPLTEERRRDLVKRAKSEGEDAKVGVRNARKSGNDEIKSLQNDGMAEDMAKRGEDEVQKLTNTYSQKVDDLIAAKEKDIMTL